MFLTLHNNPNECELWYLTQFGLVSFTCITINSSLSLKYEYTDKIFTNSLGGLRGLFRFFFLVYIQLVVYINTIFSSLMFYVCGFYFWIIYHDAGQIILPYYFR